MLLILEGLIESIPEMHALIQIDTEQLLAHLVQAQMDKQTKEGKYISQQYVELQDFEIMHKPHESKGRTSLQN